MRAAAGALLAWAAGCILAGLAAFHATAYILGIVGPWIP